MEKADDYGGIGAHEPRPFKRQTQRSRKEFTVAQLDRQAMQEALTRIQHLSDTLWESLHQTCTLMENNTWVGPAGRRFNDQVHADQQELRTMLRQAVEDAKHRLASLSAAP